MTPAAWEVQRPGDPTFPRLYRTEREARAMVDYVNVNPPATLRPLYPAAPALPPENWPSREVVAREIRRAMLDNPTDPSFNKRCEQREAIANDAADIILARFAAALPRNDGLPTTDGE